LRVRDEVATLGQVARAGYVGRIAPTPTGFLHLGHAATFLKAHQRGLGGTMILRIEDLDSQRCRTEFVDAAIEDLAWLGVRWDEGPVFQSSRRDHYLAAWRRLRDGGWIYPCACSRKDVATAPLAPHGEETVFPPHLRADPRDGLRYDVPGGINWRFRVPDGRQVQFVDRNLGPFAAVALRDFGDFVVWNRLDIPAYELAVVVDDAVMGITEIVRGEDLLVSTCRQTLLYAALGHSAPGFFHCPLVRDPDGRRLAKRDNALALRSLRECGLTRDDVMALARAALQSPVLPNREHEAEGHDEPPDQACEADD
jgi:glutamyl-tRNA synthetase